MFLIRLTQRLHPPNLSIFKPNLDTVGMKRALGQKILNQTLSQLSAALIFFKNNHNCHPRGYLFAMLSIHRLFLLVLARLPGYELKQRRGHIAHGCGKGDKKRHGIVITMDPQGQKKEKRAKEKHPHDFGDFR
jgi:hypothetical protein